MKFKRIMAFIMALLMLCLNDTVVTTSFAEEVARAASSAIEETTEGPEDSEDEDETAESLETGGGEAEAAGEDTSEAEPEDEASEAEEPETVEEPAFGIKLNAARPGMAGPLRIIHPEIEAVTYEFYVNDKKVREQVVKAGDTLYEPSTPVLEEGTNTRFAGWYMGDTALNFSDGKLTVSELPAAAGSTVRVDAKIVQYYFLTFYEADNSTVAQRVGVVVGDSFDVDTITIDPHDAYMHFGGWSDTPDSATANVSGTVTPSADASYYPVLTSDVMISFEKNTEDSATYIPPVKVENGNAAAAKPADPQREGYDFDKWTKDPDGNEAFNWNDPLNESITLYAQWKPATVNYTVIFWKQKITDDKDAAEKTYDYETSEIRQATVGTTVTPEAKDKSYGNGNRTATISGESYDFTGFECNTTKTDTQTVVAADGSSVLNVYYDRLLITIHFDFPDDEDGWLTRIDYPDDYTITGLFGQNFSQQDLVWPGVVTITKNGTETDYAPIWYFQPNTPGVGESIMSMMDSFKLYDPTLCDITFKANGELTVPIRYFKQNLDGETYPDEPALEIRSGDGDFYINDKFRGFSADHYQYKDKRGNLRDGTSLPKTPNSNGIYYTVPSASYTALDLYYRRNEYTITFVNYNDADANQQIVRKFLYETDVAAKIAQDGAPEDEVRYPDASLAQYYTFDGWYSDPGYTTPFDFNIEMPDNNMIAYAKWEPKSYCVLVDPNGGTYDGTDWFHIDYDELIGETTLNSGVHRDGYQLVGWKVKQTGNFWNFNRLVTDDVCDSTVYFNEKYGELMQITLIAQWRMSTKIKVKYYTQEGETTQLISADPTAYSQDAQAIVLPSVAAPDVKDKVFVGWQTIKDDFHAPGDSITLTPDLLMTQATDGGVDIDEDGFAVVPLYAVYVNDMPPVPLTYDPNGGTGDRKEYDNLRLNEKVQLLDKAGCGYTRPGYLLIGWNTNQAQATAGEKEYDLGGTAYHPH